MEKQKKMDTVVRYSPLDVPAIAWAHWRGGKEAWNLKAEPSTVKSDFTKQVSQDIAVSEKQFGKTEPRVWIEWNKASIEGKTDVVLNPGKYFVFADIRASETDIGELRLQDMRTAENYITFKYNILFVALSRPESMGILFFDEMNLAPNMIKAQFYKIINDKAVGDIPLSQDVMCVSAGNEAEHSRGVTEDPVPLVLRRANYFLRPLTAEEYTDYAVKTSHHPFIVGYLGFQPNDTHKLEYDLPEGVGQPCPRTWTKLSNVLRGNPDMSQVEIERTATGYVGQGVATKFAAYVKSARGIDLNAILAKPELIKKYENDQDLSLVYAIISGIVEKFRTDKKVIKPAFEIANIVERPEFGAYLLRQLKNVDEKGFMKTGGNDKLLDEKLVNEVVKRYAKFLFKNAV